MRLTFRNITVTGVCATTLTFSTAPGAQANALFSGVTETELTAVLACLDAKKTSFPKEAYLMHTGDTAEAIGFVLSGNVLTVQEDIWGNRHILSNAGPGQTFAAAFACAPGFASRQARTAVSSVSVTPENS